MTLKANSKKVLDIIATQKTRNASKAYKEVHPNASLATTQVNAAQLLKKPEAQLYLEQHVDKAKQTIVALMDAEKDDIRLRAATDVLDRNTGKAIQRTENVTTGVSLTIDLTTAIGEQAE